MFVGAVLGAAALAVSLASSFVLYKVADKVQAESDAHIAEATAEAAKANEHARTLEKAVAEANARGEEAKAEAAKAQLALEKLKTPRTLGPARQQAIVGAVKPFAGQRYEPLISQGADDGLAFWESLYVTLEKAGWKYVPVAAPSVGRPPAGIPIAAIPGVEIRIDPGKKDELVSAALALGNALHADGTVVAVNINNQSRPAEADRDILLVVIGARVPPS